MVSKLKNHMEEFWLSASHSCRLPGQKRIYIVVEEKEASSRQKEVYRYYYIHTKLNLSSNFY
jgi:hypothetical protein